MIRRLLLVSGALLLVTSALAQTPKPRSATGPQTPLPASPMGTIDKVATRSTWSFLSLEATHVETFLRAHPTYDGRGVIVMIFDTGVDPGIPGLLLTTEGGRKIIDVRDFSRTGDVELNAAERTGDELRLDKTVVVHGLNSLKLKAWSGQYWYGELQERRFQNGLEDLNFDGNDNDTFAVVVFEDQPGHFVAYIDSNGDHDLSDEHPLANYREHFDTFAFHSSDSVTSGARQLHGAVNIDPDKHLVSVYFDDGSHGTHVAGIATGHDIDNQKGFNGVAPGAEVIGVKFADNNAGGVTVTGSMQHAFQYAAEIARSQPKPVVVNMSFGIGSELEAKSAMDKWLDSLLAATPNLTVCISAGNEGPGLSSIGLPGTADRVITSGAALPDDAARDLYNLYITHPVLFDFSSRGGELAKPDIVSPGTAVSTVPDYVGGDRYNGTSMSSPYTAGCAALLLSAMKQEFSDWTTNAFMIKRAMMLSATPLEGELPVDQGYGMINVPAAYDLLVRWHKSGYTPVHSTIQTSIPTPLKSSTAAFYRAGNYPTEGERAAFNIQPEERAGINPHDRAVGMEAFDLVSDAPWLQPLQSSIYRRGEGSLGVEARYDSKLLREPGVYSGRIWAYEKGREHSKASSRFELLNTIIVPNQFSDQTNYRISLPNLKLVPGAITRQFFAIPAGARSVRFTLRTDDPKSGCNASLFDNDGHEFSGFGIRRNGTRSGSLFLSGSELRSGVLELDLSRTMSSVDEKDMAVDLTADLQPLDIPTLTTSTDASGKARVDVTLTNPSSKTFSAQPEANLVGYERQIDTTINTDEFILPFGGRPGERSVIFDISLPPEDYNLFTDITCMVLRGDSSAVFNSAFDFRVKAVPVSFSASDVDSSSESTSKYRLYIKGGLALPDHSHTWHLHIRERRVLESQPYLSSTPSLITVQPYQSQEIVLRGDDPLPRPPRGFRFFGNLNFKQTDESVVRIPFLF